MVARRFDHLVQLLPLSSSRRALLLRVIAAIPLAGSLAALLEEQALGDSEGVGADSRRKRRKARHHHNPGHNKKNRKGKRSRRRRCAKVGQVPRKGRRKGCCKGLVLNDSGRCAEPAPDSSTCGTGGPCLVFVTSTVQQGNLGGLTGADAICQERAQAASLPGVFMAWLSDAAQSPATRFVQSPGPYRRVDGVTVADNWADLTNGTLDAPITVAETGAVFNAPAGRSWTHTLANGTAGGVLNESCLNWTSNNNANNGDEGQVVATSDNWTDFASGTCNNNFHLYCFQQS